MRPYFAVHTFLAGGFTEFHRLGGVHRLVLCWGSSIDRRPFWIDRLQQAADGKWYLCKYPDER